MRRQRKEKPPVEIDNPVDIILRSLTIIVEALNAQGKALAHLHFDLIKLLNRMKPDSSASTLGIIVGKPELKVR